MNKKKLIIIVLSKKEANTHYTLEVQNAGSGQSGTF